MQFTVGGRPLDVTAEQVRESMRNALPETIRTHLVEILETMFPPKQVLATVTGWKRQSFTTMEAQRVLTKLGFVCRRAEELSDGSAAWVHDTGAAVPEPLEVRLSKLENALATADAAIAGFHTRLAVLEARNQRTVRVC